jgi:single-stranded DNA-binding protein
MNSLKLSAFCLFLACFHAPTFAQIQKGSYSFGGDLGLSTTMQSSKGFKYTDVNLRFNPSVSQFVTNNWLVGVQPILSFQNQKQTGPTGQIGQFSNYEFSGPTVGLALTSRYYEPITQKLTAFAAINAGYSRTFYHQVIKNFLVSGDSDVKGNIDDLTYGLGLGLSRALNNNVFLETSLSYQRIDASSTSSLTTNQAQINSDKWTFSLGLNNFVVGFNAKEKETPQYVKKGRQIIGGNLQINRYSTQDNDPRGVQTSVYFNPKFGQFVGDNLLITGALNYSRFTDNLSSTRQTLNATVSAQYFIPVNKRFFVHPQLSYTNSIIGGNNDYKNAIDLGIGGTYFLSKNVALTSTFLQTRLYALPANATAQQTRNLTFGLGNVGLTYFLR